MQILENPAISCKKKINTGGNGIENIHISAILVNMEQFMRNIYTTKILVWGDITMSKNLTKLNLEFGKNIATTKRHHFKLCVKCWFNGSTKHLTISS